MSDSPSTGTFHRFDKPTVASLSPAVIERLTRADLVEAICASGLRPVEDSVRSNLVHRDRATLERLVYLARRACRNQGY